MDRDTLLAWLSEDDPARLDELWRRADAIRREAVGDEIHLRGLIEISNHCARMCGYCGLRAGNTALERYRMNAPEILACARVARDAGFGTVVMQAGEDDGVSAPWLADVIRSVKESTGLAVTLSMGERPDADLALWREAGADRYLLRFETSDRDLYRRIHPDRPGRVSDRIAALRVLRDFGYEIGGGVMVGIPGQTRAILADDIALFAELDLDMIGIGPYIPNPETPLGRGEWIDPLPDGEQVPATETMTCIVLALARIVCPEANLPSTTALGTIDPEHGRTDGLARGANVVMPNVTPERYRSLYRIYPRKGNIEVDDDAFRDELLDNIRALGRTPGAGRGDRRRADTPTGKDQP